MIGDTAWDVEAARAAGIPTVCVLTGGFAGTELEDAGAAAVFAGAVELARRLEAVLAAA
jgi:phosphoglycolate phosphatase-like HAD superfamily hydrolase